MSIQIINVVGGSSGEVASFVSGMKAEETLSSGFQMAIFLRHHILGCMLHIAIAVAGWHYH